MTKTLLIYIFAILVAFVSCKKEEDPQPETADEETNEYINNWIYDNLSLYYYWTEDLPSKRIDEQEPTEYFYSLLSDQDRFSWIQPNFQELLNSLQGVTLEAGYEFILYNDESRPNGVLGQIAYVKKGSSAEDSGLKRGDKFSKINGTAMTVDNYSALLREVNEPHSLTIERFHFGKDKFEEIGVFNLKVSQFAENPNFLDTIYSENEKKIGYYVYNLFSVAPTATGSEYNDEMDEIISGFKTEGIDHLILDLRYNSGGAESATINLASLIGANISAQDVFVKREYNEGFSQALVNEYGAEFLNRKFTNKPENIGSSLKSPELIVLTSSRTASASELLINGLNPFMDIVIIGDKTVGKNVGSTSIYEDDDPDNDWGMQPIITKSFNSLGRSDYDLGFIPNIPLIDNKLVKYELGNVNELLLKEALNYLTGADVISRKRTYPEIVGEEIIGSMELKRRFGIYNIELSE